MTFTPWWVGGYFYTLVTMLNLCPELWLCHVQRADPFEACLHPVSLGTDAPHTSGNSPRRLHSRGRGDTHSPHSGNTQGSQPQKHALTSPRLKTQGACSVLRAPLGFCPVNSTHLPALPNVASSTKETPSLPFLFPEAVSWDRGRQACFVFQESLFYVT